MFKKLKLVSNDLQWVFRETFYLNAALEYAKKYYFGRLEGVFEISRHFSNNFCPFYYVLVFTLLLLSLVYMEKFWLIDNNYFA
eukprot:snap_masked-scaffold_5-processed-gene-6.8-mRNA-1 protein AED:1.00 eAED:1.00 QI:0/0/0/0/1/1/2/0/82